MQEAAGVAGASGSAPGGGGVDRWEWAAPVGIALVMGAVHLIGLASAGFYDNEGRYAEVARQMLVRGDWVTPYLNDVPILTKPPLTQWLTAVVFAVIGTSEWARILPLVASMLTVVATCRLGTRLYDRTTGLTAGVVLATMIGFALEARTLRPDALLVASCTWAILLWHGAETDSTVPRRRWLAGFWAVLGIGMLVKGLVPLVVVGPPIALWMIRRHGWRAVAEMRPGLGLVVLLAIVAPWHVAAAWANPGFAWDYVVNQHVLFAFDTKLPRDSEGDALWFFWAAMLLRTAPWWVLALLTLGHARREATSADPRRAPTLLLWTWVLGHVLVFSLTPSRLEHYTLPAHPAVALLAADAIALLGRGAFGGRAWWWVASVVVAIGAAGMALLIEGGSFVAHTYWIAQAPTMLDLVPWAGGAVALGAIWVGAAAASRDGRHVGLGLACTAAVVCFMCARALIIATPIFSWKPVAEIIRNEAPPDAEVVFEAPVEYQLVGGLAFYLGHSVTMLEPAAGFVPPTYLAGRMEGVFMSRDELAARWTGAGPIVLVSDPERRREDPAAIAPGPFTPLARFGDRWILANLSATR